MVNVCIRIIKQSKKMITKYSDLDVNLRDRIGFRGVGDLLSYITCGYIEIYFITMMYTLGIFHVCIFISR